MKQQTPATTPIVTGVLNRTTEAARVHNSSIRHSVVEFKENFHDVSLLQN
jgi:hypothetical protein